MFIYRLFEGSHSRHTLKDACEEWCNKDYYVKPFKSKSVKYYLPDCEDMMCAMRKIRSYKEHNCLIAVLVQTDDDSFWVVGATLENKNEDN